MQKITHSKQPSSSTHSSVTSKDNLNALQTRTISTSSQNTSARAQISYSESIIALFMLLINFIKSNLWKRNVERAPTTPVTPNSSPLNTALEAILTRSTLHGEGVIHIQTLKELQTVCSEMDRAQKESIGTLIVEARLTSNNFPQFQKALLGLHSLVNGDVRVKILFDNLEIFCSTDVSPDIAPLLNEVEINNHSAHPVHITASLAYALQNKLKQMTNLHLISMGHLDLDQYVPLCIPQSIRQITLGYLKGHLTFAENSNCTCLICEGITSSGSLVIPTNMREFSSVSISGPVTFEKGSTCRVLKCGDIAPNLEFIIPKSVEEFEASKISSKTSFEPGSQCEIVELDVVPEGYTFVLPDSADLINEKNVGKVTYSDGTPARVIVLGFDLFD